MSTQAVVRVSEALGVIEAAHSGHGDLTAWCAGLIDAGRRFFLGVLVNAAVVRRDETHYTPVGYASTEARVTDYMGAQGAAVPTADLDPYARCPTYCSTIAGLGMEPTPGAAEFQNLFDGSDVLGLVGIVDQYSVTIGVPYPIERLRLAARDHRLLVQVALHLEAGLRLRLEPAATLGLLSPDGRLLHAEQELKEASNQVALSDHVKSVERLRLREHRGLESAASAWSALVSGTWGIVERVESDGKRLYSVIDTRATQRLRQLSRLETQVVELSARGLSGKAVAYALGVTTPAVSQALLSAALKLGVHSRTEVVALAARLLGTPRDSERHAELTPAEREVLALVRMGYTNADIARGRQRSERTVANQVAALLHKLEAPSRRALAAQ